jgi:hypothetical protein
MSYGVDFLIFISSFFPSSLRLSSSFGRRLFRSPDRSPTGMAEKCAQIAALDSLLCRNRFTHSYFLFTLYYTLDSLLLPSHSTGARFTISLETFLSTSSSHFRF